VAAGPWRVRIAGGFIARDGFEDVMNSMVVTKKVQDSQIESKCQSISTGRAQ